MAKYHKLTTAEYAHLLGLVQGTLEKEPGLGAYMVYKKIKSTYQGKTKLTPGQVTAMWRKIVGYVPPRKRRSTNKVVKVQAGPTVYDSYTWPANNKSTTTVGQIDVTFSDNNSFMKDHAISLIELGLRLLKGGNVA